MEAGGHGSTSPSPFKNASQQMLGSTEGLDRPLNSPMHKRPSLAQVYMPHPAPGSTIAAPPSSKSALRNPGTPSSGMRVSLANEEAKDTGMPSFKAGLPDGSQLKQDYETPRSQWRKQYWQKSTPWATDRRVYTGGAMYQTSLKPQARNYDGSSRWEYDPTLEGLNNSEDVVRQIVEKLEQHCNSTFAMTRAFKLFDRDMSSTIDTEEMRQVLISFSIDLSDAQLHAVMSDFGAVDRGKGQGLEIRYPSFVKAIDKLATKHPLQVNTGRFIKDLKGTFIRDAAGRRICTPGFKAPVGCPTAGCFYPADADAPVSRSPTRLL